jgi:pSer/pThr/pTyr-binding forkhead associated (FHA) protein
MRQCSTCGSNLPENISVCPDCGMEVKSSIPPVEATAGPNPPRVPAPPAEATAPSGATPAPPGASPGARLTLRRGGALTGEVFKLSKGRSLMGRFDPETGPVDVDLGPLPEAVYVSRHHAEIWCNDSGEWIVKDLGSGNGTFVCAAGQREFQKAADEQSIKDGDEIALGNARFEFRID